MTTAFPIDRPAVSQPDEATARPDPAALGVAEVAQLFAALRQRRLDLMAQLAQQNSGDDPAIDPASFIDHMESQAELLELLEYLRRLQARAKSIEAWEPADRIAPDFADMTGDGRHWLAGRGQCPLTPDSVLFLHAPVTLWYAATLAESLLDTNDRLTWLRKASFHKELAHEPRFVVWDTAQGKPPEQMDRAAIAVQGLFETAQGRQLAFATTADTRHPLTRKADYHPMVYEIAARPPSIDRDTWQFRYDFSLGAWPPPDQKIGGAAAVFAMMESLITALSHALDDGQRLFLFSAVADRPIPDDFAAWLAARPRYQIDLSWDRKRTVPGRGAFIPGRYRVTPTDEAWSQGVMVCLDSHLLF